MTPGATKYAMPFNILDEIEEAAEKKHGRASDEYRIWKALRYFGMHAICLYDPKSQLREFKKGGQSYVVWWRPMKGAKKNQPGMWKKLPEYPKHKAVDFNVQELYEELRDRRRKTGYMYIYRTVSTLGRLANVSDISPNTLRHNHLMYLLEVQKLPMKNACDFLGCSVETGTKHYDAWGKQTVEERLIASGEFR